MEQLYANEAFLGNDAERLQGLDVGDLKPHAGRMHEVSDGTAWRQIVVKAMN